MWELRAVAVWAVAATAVAVMAVGATEEPGESEEAALA